MDYDEVVGHLRSFYPAGFDYADPANDDELLRHLMAKLKAQHQTLRTADEQNYTLYGSPEAQSVVGSAIQRFFFEEPVNKYPEMCRQLTKRALIDFKTNGMITELGYDVLYEYIKTFSHVCNRMNQLTAPAATIAEEQHNLNKFLKHFRDVCLSSEGGGASGAPP